MLDITDNGLMINPVEAECDTLTKMSTMGHLQMGRNMVSTANTNTILEVCIRVNGIKI